MREFYGSGQRSPPLASPSSGQLVAIRAEEEEEILRARVCEVMDDKVKVRRSLKTGKEAPAGRVLQPQSEPEKLRSGSVPDGKRQYSDATAVCVCAGALRGSRLLRGHQQKQSV